MGLQRGLSDHCAVLLRDKVVDWGPKLFRMLNCWREISGYAEFVKTEWDSLDVDGWSAFVLKEKFKFLKQKLKEWNKTHCGNLNDQIVNAKSDLEAWDLEGEESHLSEEESALRRECMANLRRLSRKWCSVQCQKARVRWLQDGDSNSMFFHGCINKKKRMSEILCLNFGG